MNKLTFVVILINSAAVSASRHIFSLPKVFHSLISTPDDSNCADGVCEIKTNNIVSSQNLESKVLDDWSSSQNMTSDQLEDIEQKVKEISKMGWKEVEARKALALSNYDVGEACVFLEKEEDDRAVLLDQVKEIMANGWSKEAAESAAIECKGNITAALALLDSEEEAILSNFENAVQDMVRIKQQILWFILFFSCMLITSVSAKQWVGRSGGETSASGSMEFGPTESNGKEYNHPA